LSLKFWLLPAAVAQALLCHQMSPAAAEPVGWFINRLEALQFLVHLQLQLEPVARSELMAAIQFLTQSLALAAVTAELNSHFLPMVVQAVVLLGSRLTTRPEREPKVILAVELVLVILAELTQSELGRVTIRRPVVAVPARLVIMEVYQRKAEMVESADSIQSMGQLLIIQVAAVARLGLLRL
jgi:hypothetical protein